jgi:DNA-binding NtrC family response regulator
MRKLLVISPDDLSDDVATALQEKHWSIRHVRETDALERLVQEEHILVGLIVFPVARDTRHETHLCRQISRSTGLKWVAIVNEGQIQQPDFRNFVAECLYDFHVRPVDAERLAIVLGHAYGMARVEHDLRDATAKGVPNHFGLIGESPVMRHHYRLLQRAAESDVSVLITGPTGTGKELAARAIHDYSPRSSGPFVAINCAAIPPTLLQSELFGHEKGSFTSANARKSGYIHSAAGGTLFLDEIGDMPLESQATLLRFLEDKIVTPIGSTRGTAVDVRIIASTNVDLERAIAERAFRADLYYRLAFLTVQTPPLHERGADIELLARQFLEEVMRDLGLRRLQFGQDALAALRAHHWPGNVRELRSVIFQAALNCEGLSIRPEDLKIMNMDQGLVAPGHEPNHMEPPDRLNGTASHHGASTLKSIRAQSEKRNLEYALARNGSNITRTAQDLGVSRMTLYRLMAKHGVARTSAD